MQRELPDNFFECNHGYPHYGDCPLHSRFPSEVVEAIDEFCDEGEGEEIPIEAMVELADFVSGYRFQ